MRYKAFVGGASIAREISAVFSTISAAREWAESFGDTADWCDIRTLLGHTVARHQRNPSSGRWFRADFGG